MSAASASGAYSPSLNSQQQLQPHKRAASANGQMAAGAHKTHAAAAQTYAAQTAPTSHPQMHSGLPLLQAVPSGGAAAAAAQQNYATYQYPAPASSDALLIYNTASLLTAMPAVQANVTVRLSDGRLLTIIIDPPTQKS